MRQHGFDGDDAAALQHLLEVAEEDFATVRDAVEVYGERGTSEGGIPASECARLLVEMMYRSGWIEFVAHTAAGQGAAMARDTIEQLLVAGPAWDQAVSNPESVRIVLTDAGFRRLAGGD